MTTKLLPVKSTIKYGDLDKLDIRVGRIEKVEDVEKSDKLVRLTVNFGDFKRNILVGLKKERKDPREIEGKQALFVVNLESKEMMESFRKECCLILDTPMALSQYLLCRKKKFLMGLMLDNFIVNL